MRSAATISHSSAWMRPFLATLRPYAPSPTVSFEMSHVTMPDSQLWRSSSLTMRVPSEGIARTSAPVSKASICGATSIIPLWVA